MNIQISVLIWTILSFCALAAVLNKFLFKPVLKVMDDRQKKIDDYQNEKLARLNKNEELRLEAENQRIAAQKTAMAEGEKAVEKEKAKTAKELDKAKEKYESLLEQRRTELQSESETIEHELDGKIDELALAYVSAILS